MVVRTQIHSLVVGAALVSVSGCLAPGADPLNLVSAAPATVLDAASLPGDLYVKVLVGPEDGDDTKLINYITCSIPEGSATVSMNCSGSIPEGNLYFGRIRFTLGTSNPAACHRLTFHPYYYQLSNNVAYVPIATSATPPIAIDCSGATQPVPLGCFNGIAPDIVPNFPIYHGIYFIPQTASEKNFDDTSANMKFMPNNRFTCNNLMNQAFVDPNYVANSMVPYVIECRDAYDEVQKQITLTIGDIDTVNGDTPLTPTDNFNDWGGN